MEYVINCDTLEMEYGEAFNVLPGAPVQSGQLALLDIEGYLIPGRLDGTGLELPGLRIELGPNLRWRVVGPVVRIKPGKTYLN